MVEQEDSQEEGVKQGEGGQQAGERRPVLRGGTSYQSWGVVFGLEEEKGVTS